MKRALLCSGQGRIDRNMLDPFVRAPAAASVLEAARTLLGRDPVELLARVDEDVLLEDRISQVLCTTRSLSAYLSLDSRAPTMVAGYSIGEMAAWGVAGIWDPIETLRLAAARAEFMDQVDGHRGGLGFVRGLDIDVLKDLLAEHGCAIAILNPDRMFIIGGERAAVAACCQSAIGRGALSARPIPVHVASHTPRLAAAVGPFLAALARSPSRPPHPDKMLIGAAEARPITSAQDGMSGLAHQLAQTVDWNAVLVSLVERGAERLLELGPGDALAKMVRAAWPQIEARSIDDFRTPEGARSWFEAA